MGGVPRRRGGQVAGAPIAPRRDTLPSVIEISACADEADEQRGLDVYNAIWPDDRIGLEEARSYRAGQLDNLDLLVRIDGAVGGAAIGSIQPQWPGFRRRVRVGASRGPSPRGRHRAPRGDLDLGP